MEQHTIAIVADEPGVLKALSQLLSVSGYRVTPFASAADFFRAAPRSEAACLIVDIHLRDTSGLELVRQLAFDGFEFPIIFISSFDDDVVRMRCEELNCVAYLQKPWPEGRLIEAVAKAVGPDTKPV